MQALIGLLLPGSVFCVLMFMERHKRQPQILVYGRLLPVWLVYIVVFFGAPVLLVLMLIDTLKRT